MILDEILAYRKIQLENEKGADFLPTNWKTC